MKQLVDDILGQRRARENRRRRLVAGAVALTGHATLAALVALAPAFAARRQEPVRDYMRVMIVPAKALGDAAAPPKPAATPPKPRQTAPQPAAKKDKNEPKPSGLTDSPRSERSAPATTAPDPLDPLDGVLDQETATRRGGPDGTSFGTSAFGSSEASFDDPNFMYGYYVQQMLALIGGNWLRPRANPGTEMVIHFNISRQGVLSEIEVVKESGNRSFDLAGYRAVTLSSPLPPLPQSYPFDSLGVNLVIR